MITTGLFVDPELWDAESRRARPQHPNWRRLNLQLDKWAIEAEEFILANKDDQSTEAVKRLEFTLFPERTERAAVVQQQKSDQLKESRLLLSVAIRFAESKREKSTRETYLRLVRHLERFARDAMLDDVSRVWLERFDKYLMGYAPSANARALYMRNLRAVFNFAIDEGLTSNYPFRQYRIKTVKTAKRNLRAEELRRLFAAEVEDWQRPYRDFFFLSFFLIGTNPKDLLYLPAGADRSGRVTFHRSKTKKLYSIKVEPEAAEIISRLRGREHLLQFMDSRSDYLQFIRYCNHGLQTIGMDCAMGRKPSGEALFPGLTLYWARHSWATIAAELDVPVDTIAAALGHDMGNRTTAIYIEFNQAKVDEANRRVIDYVLYGRK